MSKATSALEFLKKDLEETQKQWKEGKPFESLPQRNPKAKTLHDLLDLFDPKEDETDWMVEVVNQNDETKTRLYRRRIAFLKAARKEFYEEYNDEVTDVDYMRLLELPYTDPKDALQFSLEELKD